MNSASDGHNSGDKGDSDPEVLIVGTVLSNLGGGSFVQVRGGFGGAVEIDVVDDAAVEVTAERDVTYQAGVGIEGEVDFEITLAACVGGGGGDVVVDPNGASSVASKAGDDVHDAIVCNDAAGVFFTGENMVTVGINEVSLASALSAGVSRGLHGRWGGVEGHAI